MKCNYCTTETDGYVNQFVPMNHKMGEREIKGFITSNVGKPVIRLSFGNVTTEVEISCCPFCGRRLI